MEKLWFLCLGEGGSAAGVMWLLIKRADCLALCKSHGRNKAAQVVKALFLCLWSSLESWGNKHQPKAFTINHVCVSWDTKAAAVWQCQIKGVTSYLRPLLAYYYYWSSVTISTLTLCVVDWITRDSVIIDRILTSGESVRIFLINRKAMRSIGSIFWVNRFQFV